MCYPPSSLRSSSTFRWNCACKCEQAQQPAARSAQVVALLALAGALVGGGLIYTVCRLCACASRPRPKLPLPIAAAPVPARGTAGHGRPSQFMTSAPAYPATNGAYGAPSGSYAAANGHAARDARPSGVTYDARTGMFLLNGQPYGRMQGH